MSKILGYSKGSLQEFEAFNTSVNSSLNLPDFNTDTIQYTEKIPHPNSAISDFIWIVDIHCPVDLIPQTLYSQSEVENMGWL